MASTVTLLVSALVSTESGKVILTAHPPSHKLHLPDGDVRVGETLRQALIRSFVHDLGVPVVPEEKPCWVSETVTKTVHYVTIHYKAALADPKAALVPASGLSVLYPRARDLAGLALSATTKEALFHVLGWKC